MIQIKCHAGTQSSIWPLWLPRVLVFFFLLTGRRSIGLGAHSRPVECGEDRPEAFFDSAAHLRVRENVKFVIANSVKDSSSHFRWVHASAGQFG